MSGFSAVTYALAKKASKQYADYLFSKVGALDIQFVDSLPTVDIKEKTIYFVPASAEKTSYNQYMYVDSNWVLVGSTELNLDNYYTKDEINELLFIKSVDDSNFIVNEAGQLSLNPVAGRLITQDEVSTLQKVVNGEFNNFIKSVNTDIFSVDTNSKLDLIAIPTSLLTPVIGDMTDLTDYTEGTTIVNEINKIYDRLTWQEIPQII